MLLTVIMFDITVLAQESSAEILSQNEIFSLLSEPDMSLPTEEEFEKIQDNLTYILDSDSETEIQKKIEELDLEQWVELTDCNTNLDRPQTRIGRPGMFSADFINRNITAAMFNVSLEFTNYTPYMCIQVAGYVKYYYRTAGISKELSISAPYVNELSIRANSVRIAGHYSYPHYKQIARYEGNFVVIDQSEVPKVMQTVKEHKN